MTRENADDIKKEYQRILEKLQAQETSSGKNSDEIMIKVENSEIIGFDSEDTMVLSKDELKKELQAVNSNYQDFDTTKISDWPQTNAVYEEELQNPQANVYKDVVLEVLGLTKKIGRKTIVEDITFDMHKGEITGLLGPNGSGKTTIMRMLVALTKATKGEVYCFEKKLGMGYTKMLSEVGSMIESPEFYNYLSGYANLKQIARLSDKKISRKKIKELLAFVGLEKVARKKVKTYSLGMRQRLGLAQALLNDPKILILDEPVNGLDPQGVQDFRNKLKEIADKGVSILISSHLLDEIEKVADRIIVIEKGKIVADDTIENLAIEDNEITVLITSDTREASSLIQELNIDFNLEGDKILFENLDKEDKAKIVAYLVTNNVEIESLYVEKKSLEDRFLEITGRGGL